MSEPIRIIIIEDNKTFATTLNKMLTLSDGMQCIATFGNADDFLSALQNGQLPETDLILLDLQLPGKNGLTLVPVVKKDLPDTNILILTQNNNYLVTLEAIKLGVEGYILKKSPIADIRSAIWEVYQGGSVIDPQLSRLVLKTLNSDSFVDDNPLSERELQVLELLAMGYVKKVIPDQLGISYSAVLRYTERIYKKLQVPNVAAAVATAIRKGLI